MIGSNERAILQTLNNHTFPVSWKFATTPRELYKTKRRLPVGRETFVNPKNVVFLYSIKKLLNGHGFCKFWCMNKSINCSTMFIFYNWWTGELVLNFENFMDVCFILSEKLKYNYLCWILIRLNNISIQCKSKLLERRCATFRSAVPHRVNEIR